MKQNESRYIEENIPFRRVPLIDGISHRVDTRSVVGYCHCSKHKGYLNITLLKSHDCIKKECVYLEKFEDYPFWIQYMNLQKQKERRKRAKKHSIECKESAERKMEKMIESAQNIADRLGYRILVIKVVPRFDTKENYEYIVNYISDNQYDDWHFYFDLALTLGKCFGGKYILKHIKKPDGNYAVFSDWKNR